MDNEVQQDPQEAPAQPEPQVQESPQYDLETAYDVIARAEGWDPRLARLQVQELKERKEALDRREREIERERQQFQAYKPPTPEFADPYQRELYETKQLVQQLVADRQAEQEERRKREENDRLVQRLSQELESSYTTAARQSGMTKNQIDDESKEFFRVLTQIYPEPDMISRIGTDNAVRTAFRVFRGTNRQYNPIPSGPRAQFVVPTQGSGPNGSTDVPTGPDFGAQRPGESTDQYHNRLKRSFQESGFSASGIMPDKGRVSSG